MLKNYSKIIVYENDDKEYLNDKEQLHRLDGPAVECLDGTKYWLINGNVHRNIDPSDEWLNGEKRWVFKGKYHRVGGSFNSAFSWWYIDDKGYAKQEYFNKVWDI